MAAVKDILAIMNEIAPRETAESWDNPGLLVGDPAAAVEKILLCVDATEGVIREAVQTGAQLVISHHPLMFRAIKQVRDDDPEGHVICELIRNNLNLIAAHTNLDQAAGGVNDSLAAALGIEEVSAPEPYLRTGRLSGRFGALADDIALKLDTQILRYGPEDAEIERVALCSGAGGSEIDAAAQCGAQLFVTGEMKHNELIRARQLGMCVLLCGHFETERVVLSPLANGLQMRLNELQYKEKVYVSRVHPLA